MSIVSEISPTNNPASPNTIVQNDNILVDLSRTPSIVIPSNPNRRQLIANLQDSIAGLLQSFDDSTAPLSSESTSISESLDRDNFDASTDNDTVAPPPFKSQQPPYHNPRHLGTLPFYYPRRLAPILNSIPDVHPVPGQNPYVSTTTPAIDNEHLTPLTPTFSPEVPRTRRYHQTSLNNGCWDEFQSTCTDLQQNESWGDDFLIKDDNTFRIYFQNVNSCGLSSGTGKWNDIIQSMCTSECDIVNFVQTSANWKMLQIRNRMHDTIRRHMPIYKLVTGHNRFVSEQATLPGGTAQIVKGNWTARVMETIQDPSTMGRWCGTRLRLKHDRSLYIICAYRVCNQSLSQVSVETAYGQQHYMLSIDGNTHPNPRRQFIEDLVATIKKLQTGLDEFLILLDANEQLGSNTHGLTHLMRECHLIDLFHQHHGVCPEFPTFDMGNQRLDYAIGSATLLPFLHKCGYLPFYQGVSSDHRGLYVDFSLELIDGLTQLEHIPKRYLHSSFQKDVYSYKQHIHHAFQRHNIYYRAESLYHLSGSIKQDNLDYQDQLEKLDRLIVDLQLQAEMKCCKSRTKFDWSDEIHYHKIILNYWSIHRKAFTRKKNVQAVTQLIYQTLPLTYQQFIDISTGSPLNNWLKTKLKLKTLMAQLRKTMAEASLACFENEANFTGSTAEQVQLKHERVKQDQKLYQTLRQHFHPSTRSGISHLIVPDTDIAGNPTDDVAEAHTWRSETSPQPILDRLLSRNIQHFGQAQGTPFTIPPLLEKFGYNGMSHQGQQLSQEGILPLSIANISPVSIDVLHRVGNEQYRQPPNYDLISFPAFTSAIKKWRESTSTSPSGRHLGHYKSLLTIDSQSSKYTEASPDPGPDLLKVIYHVALSAFQSGISLSRWTNITTCMIEKLPGIPRINKLRIIHLYEADYNVVQKLVWQRGVVWAAHNNGILNKAQSGTRPHRTCFDVVMSKEMKYLNSILTRTNMATMDNDAKSCYDRIVASLALLISHQFGVPAEICRTVGETLQRMQFHLRTAMGDSNEYYQHSNDTPIHGVGQGGTASPAFWLLISSALFDCHQQKATGMKMQDPSNTITLHQWLEAIVDDTSIFTNLDRSQSIQQLVTALEKDSQYWENLLSVSGGCLELSKCFYYVLAWTFTSEGDPRPLDITELNAVASPLHLTEYGNLDPTSINLKSPQTAHKTLGVWKSMIGNDKDHIQHLKQRSNNMASIVATSGLKPNQAEVAVRMIYTPAMGYSLPSTNIKEKIVNKIQAKALESFVPAIGYNGHMPRAVILGPSEFGGCAIPHLHTESKIQQIQLIIANVRANTELGKLFMINLNWIQLSTGLQEPYLASHFPIPYLVENWFTGIREFLTKINGRLEFPQLLQPKFERQGDQTIMNMMLKATPRLSANQQRYINNWRFYFQVTTLSDLCNAKGDAICEKFLTRPEPRPLGYLHEGRRSKLLWPVQQAPQSEKTFKLWVKYIRKLFLKNSGCKLRQPMGSWQVTPEASQSSWPYYMDTNRSTLFVRQHDGYLQLQQIHHCTPGTITFHETESSLHAIPPPHHIPVDVTTSVFEDKLQYCVHHSPRLHLMLQLPPSFYPKSPDNLLGAIQNAPIWQQHLLQYFLIHDVDQLLTSLSDADQKFYCVSDGGLKDQVGSSGVAAGTATTELYRIEGPVQGFREHLNSFRSEGYGMLANVNFLTVLLQVYRPVIPVNRKLHIFCDNLPLVRRIHKLRFQHLNPRIFLKSEADVLLQIAHDIQILESANFQIIIDHVKGHQDDHAQYHELSRESQLNVNADTYATNYLLFGDTPSYDIFPANPVNFYINDNIINRTIPTEIRKSSLSPDLRVYLNKKFQWEDATTDMIWWSIHGSSIDSFSMADRRRIRKYIFNWLPTSERLKKYHQIISDICPSCNVCVETHLHLHQCTTTPRITIIDNWLEKLDAFLSIDRYTPPLLRRLFLYRLNRIFIPSTSGPFQALPPSISQAAQDQSTIGWHQLLRGRLAYRWGIIIADFLDQQHIGEKEMTALRWGRTFNKLVFQLILSIWQLRNLDGHTLTPLKESALTRNRLLLRIQSLQDSNPDVTYRHRDFIYRPMDIISKYTIANLRSWLRAAENIVKINKRRRIAPTEISQFWISNPDNPVM